MRVKSITPRIHHVMGAKPSVLARAFLRFQEHYESPGFRGKIFTLGVFRQWYKAHKGSFSYYTDWKGFNFPGHILTPFRTGLFDPLAPQEMRLLRMLKNVKKNHYVIGACCKDLETLEHEICHALWYTESEYKRACRRVLKGKNLASLFSWLREKGYCKEVLLDEAHAYLSADYAELPKRFAKYKKIHEKLRKIRAKYPI